MSSQSNLPDPNRYLWVWRWAFLCSEAALIALIAVSVYGWGQGGIARNIDQFYHPFRGGIVMVVLCLTISFQFFGGPFFFRRLGLLAVVSWLSALTAFVWINLPVF